MLLLLAALGTLFVGSRLVIKLLQPPAQWDISLQWYGELVALIALVLVLGLLVYRVAAALTLAYELDRNGIYIFWLGNRVVIPINRIERLDSGDRQAVVPRHLLQGIGYYSGQGRTSTSIPLYLFSTSAPARSLMVHTSSAVYAVSPAEQDDFVEQLEQRRKLGVTKTLALTTERGSLLFYDFWSDRVVRWALLLAFGINLLLCGVLVARYPDLAGLVATQFDAMGQATGFRPRYQVLFLPLAACFISLVNTLLGLLLYRRNRIGVSLLQGASVLVQLLFGIAVLMMLFRS